MRSIRNRILIWLLGGVGVVLLAAGTFVYFTARHVLQSQVDDELQEARRVVYHLYQQGTLSEGAFLASDSRPGRTPRLRESDRWREFDLEDGELLYQLRAADGKIIARSASLGDRTIPQAENPADPRQSAMLKASDGTLLRARIDLASPPRSPSRKRDRNAAEKGESIEIIVARDLTGIGHTLSLLLGGIWLAGLVIAAATAAFVTLVLRRGLSPLRSLGREVSQVDATSLTARFDDHDMPQELQPICNRLNDLMARLEGSFQRERRFSSDLAHELRTPLAELSAMAEAAIRFPDKIPPGRFEDILGSTRDMQRIVESLLTLARWEEGSYQLDRMEVDVAELVEECWDPFSDLAGQRELDVSLTVAKGQTLTTDPGLFRHILKNLFSNATEYTPRGGSVTIGTLSSASQVPAGLFVSNSVEDMTDSEIPHLFERFWRNDGSRTGSSHSGLGLSLARACAETLSLRLAAKLENGHLRFEVAPG